MFFGFDNFSGQPRQTLPEDGLPLLEDWLRVYEGMTLHGLDLAREPIAVAVTNSEFKTSKSNCLALFH